MRYMSAHLPNLPHHPPTIITEPYHHHAPCYPMIQALNPPLHHVATHRLIITEPGYDVNATTTVLDALDAPYTLLRVDASNADQLVENSSFWQDGANGAFGGIFMQVSTGARVWFVGFRVLAATAAAALQCVHKRRSAGSRTCRQKAGNGTAAAVHVAACFTKLLQCAPPVDQQYRCQMHLLASSEPHQAVVINLVNCCLSQDFIRVPSTRPAVV